MFSEINKNIYFSVLGVLQKTDHSSIKIIEFENIKLKKHYCNEQVVLNPQNLNKKRECINHKTWIMAWRVAPPLLEPRI